ncbi:MAG: hypothetical protein ACM3PP_13775 [Candidatus Saccharibacteria bacterium]
MVKIEPALWVIIPVSISSAVLVFLRAAQMADPAVVAAKGAAVAGLQSAISYLVGGVVSGVIFTYVYLWMLSKWPASAVGIFHWLGIGLAAMFTVLVLVLFPMWKRAGMAEYIFLNVLWGAAYGWVLPYVMR